MRKHAKHTEFACFVRNITPSPLRLTVPFGTIENRPRLSEAEYEELLALNRSRYCAAAADQQLTRTRKPVLQASSSGGLRCSRRDGVEDTVCHRPHTEYTAAALSAGGETASLQPAGPEYIIGAARYPGNAETQCP
jgi:hypothetical protein